MERTLTEQELLKETTEYTGVHPKKFALWVAMASMTMFFAALTSALLVKKGDYQEWENFKLPDVFMYSTVVIIALSVVIQLSLMSYRKAKFFQFRSLLFFSLLLGGLFLYLQVVGWGILTAMGKPLTGNLSGSFIYLITSMHGLHLLIGILVTLIFFVMALRSRKDPNYELKNIINPNRLLRLELLVGFWHYIDAVWIYLYVFFYINYQ